MAQRTIMIIDDASDHRDIVGRLLRGVGFRVIEAAPGDEALCTARSAQPDLILSALSLPGQPAWETTRRLHAEPVLAATPILGTTIYDTLLPWAWMRRIGCTDFVDKPFDIDELLRRIERLLPDMPCAPLAA
ncbi:MAG TPA: response regulator [Kouleothrix sp.]|uniref:response regulator n=1 Tax=Kouleothrix sp. TaxID=2779161 RepID=UPI002BD0FDAA|nr:response regulator [Kouleothrix sp.]HRC78048.1 response regulator [Kouleothrix sp.]